MIIFISILVIACIISFGVFYKATIRICESKKRLDGKNVLVTGGTAGMGVEIATELARRGARVIVAGPCAAEGEEACARIATLSANPHVRYSHLDLASLASVRRFAADVLRTQRTLDLLVNNAGVGGPSDATTKDDINYVMQVNYFGTFLLTMLLLPLLKKSGRPGNPSRIINTSSILHAVGTVDIDNFAFKKVKFGLEYYCDSKFCIVLFTRELAKRLRGENVVVNSLNPGATGTMIFYEFGSWFGFVVSWFFYCCCKTPWQGAQTALHVALDDDAGTVSGEFFENCRIARAVSRVYDDKLSKRVWEESLKLVELKNDVQN